MVNSNTVVVVPMLASLLISNRPERVERVGYWWTRPTDCDAWSPASLVRLDGSWSVGLYVRVVAGLGARVWSRLGTRMCGGLRAHPNPNKNSLSKLNPILRSALYVISLPPGRFVVLGGEGKVH